MTPVFAAIAVLCFIIAASLFRTNRELDRRRPQWKENTQKHRASDHEYLWLWDGNTWIALTVEDLGRCLERGRRNPEDKPK